MLNARSSCCRLIERKLKTYTSDKLKKLAMCTL